MQKVRTLFLSDLHLLSDKCNIDELEYLLDNLEYENLILVGDIIDYTRYIKAKGVCKEEARHHQVMNKFFSQLEGPGSYYVLGNHEGDLFNSLVNPSIGYEYLHTTLKGDSYLVEHGHKLCNPTPNFGNFVSYLVDVAVNFLSSKPLYKYSSKSITYIYWIKRFEEAMVDKIFWHTGLMGIITGHSHSPCLYFDRDKEVVVANCGDFVYNNSYLVETLKGDLELRSLKSKNDLRSQPVPGLVGIL